MMKLGGGFLFNGIPICAFFLDQKILLSFTNEPDFMAALRKIRFLVSKSSSVKKNDEAVVQAFLIRGME